MTESVLADQHSDARPSRKTLFAHTLAMTILVCMTAILGDHDPPA